jgi:D-alanyl-D-alanine dipeptidase
MRPILAAICAITLFACRDAVLPAVPEVTSAVPPPVVDNAPHALIDAIGKGESKAFVIDRAAYAGNLRGLPIGVFDSGIGGLTVLSAILKVDEFDNRTHAANSDGVPDFADERFVYFGDQANMPYGRYASEGKENFLRELIVEDSAFLLGTKWFPSPGAQPRNDKPRVKAVVVACNTATAYGIDDLRAAFAAWHIPMILVGVVEAGSEGAALAMKKRNDGSAVAVMATVGTCASNAYPRTIVRDAEALGLDAPVVVQHGSVGLAGAIEGDPAFVHAPAMTSSYQGPKPDPALSYDFEAAGMNGAELNSVENYVRYDVTSLVDDYKKQGGKAPIGSFVLGCTHFPFQKESIAASLQRLRARPEYASLISAQVDLVDPAALTARELYTALVKGNRLRDAKTPPAVADNMFFISKPEFDPKDKYTRSAGNFEHDAVKRVPMRPDDLTPELRGLVARSMPEVHASFTQFQMSHWLGATFRITPARPIAEVKKEALAATPPAPEPGTRAPELVELVKLDPKLELDIRYATTNNFLGVKLYDEPRAFLQRPAAEALKRVDAALTKQGFGLLVHDGYRPWYVTKMFWEATPPDKRIYVAPPTHGSRHNRGCAVDLTLLDRATGKPAEMPSAYDEMSERARASYPGGTPEQRRLRDLLRAAMEAEGFTVYEEEWWHFDYKDWKSYPVTNVPFEKLGKR